MDFFIIFTVAFSLLLLTNVLSKFLINQKDVKAKKDRIGELNKEMKNKKNDVDGTKKLMGEILRENNSIFKMTMKPLLVSFVFVIIALPIIHGIYNDKFLAQNSTEVEIGNIFESHKYAVQLNGDKVTVGDTTCTIPCNAQQLNGAIFNIKTEERVLLKYPEEKTVDIQNGRGEFSFGFLDETHFVEKDGNEVKIDSTTCTLPCEGIKIDDKTLNVQDADQIKFERVMLLMPFSLPILGNDMGWLAAYIIISVPIMIIQKRFLKVYS